MNHLDSLEGKNVSILRDAVGRIHRLATSWSIGEDSNVVLWPAGKASVGRVPFPVIHVDTAYKLPEMI